MRQAKIYHLNRLAGVLSEDENDYTFRNDEDYLNFEEAESISLTMPLSAKPYNEKILFPFFDGLIPEGWLLDIAEKNLKIKRADFQIAMIKSGLEEKITDNLFGKFKKATDK